MPLVRAGLTTRFAVLSAVAITGMGIGLQVALRDMIERRAVNDAVASVRTVTELSVQPHITPEELDKGLTQQRREELDQRLRLGDSPTAVRRIKIFSRNHTIVYSDDPAAIGGRYPQSEPVTAALQGHPSSHLARQDDDEHRTERPLGRLLEVFIPLRYDGAGGPVAGVVEMYLPYEPVRAAVAADSRQLAWLLVAGLSVLYLVLFRIVRRASRALRAEAARNEYQATHDALTSLPNRALLFARVAAALTSSRPGRQVAVMLLDLDGFKEINDTLGHHHGDVVLQDTAQRLVAAVGGEGVVARLGGDEFGLLIPDTDDTAARAMAARLLRALKRPFVVDALQLSVSGSLGIALYPDHGADAADLLQRADVAMYLAKSARTGLEVYSPGRDRYSAERLALITALSHAIEAAHILVAYQPQIDLRTSDVVGFEALARWRHPVQGSISPDDFVPLAENAGLIRPLTELVVTQALDSCAAWRRAGLALTVAVNISARTLLDADFPDYISAELEARGLPPELLVLELTESSVMHDPQQAETTLRTLSNLGVQLSIDDFGTGYSSLSYLQRLPVCEMKIDRRFVTGLARTPADRVIVQSTVGLAKSLGLRVVAEGVADAPSRQLLAELGCDIAQGFVFARPMPGPIVAAWVRDWRDEEMGGLAAMAMEV